MEKGTAEIRDTPITPSKPNSEEAAGQFARAVKNLISSNHITHHRPMLQNKVSNVEESQYIGGEGMRKYCYSPLGTATFGREIEDHGSDAINSMIESSYYNTNNVAAVVEQQAVGSSHKTLIEEDGAMSYSASLGKDNSRSKNDHEKENNVGSNYDHNLKTHKPTTNSNNCQEIHVVNEKSSYVDSKNKTVMNEHPEEQPKSSSQTTVIIEPSGSTILANNISSKEAVIDEDDLSNINTADLDDLLMEVQSSKSTDGLIECEKETDCHQELVNSCTASEVRHMQIGNNPHYITNSKVSIEDSENGNEEPKTPIRVTKRDPSLLQHRHTAIKKASKSNRLK